MRHPFRLAWMLPVLLLAGTGSVSAHDSPFSHINLILRDAFIEGTVVVHHLDAAHDLDVKDPRQLLDGGFLEARRQALIALLAPRLNLSVDGRPATPEWTGIEALPLHIRIHFRLNAIAPKVLTLNPRLFPYDPKHQTFVNVYDGELLRQQFIFTVRSDERTFYVGLAQTTSTVLATFIPSGIKHILIGPDHILFLIGLLLPGGSGKTLVKIVTAFTVGHSITLSLAALNVVSPPAWIIEPAIALSIVFVGVENLVRRGGRDVRIWIALAFGLVHGFGFANVLREFGLPRQALGWSLFAFNLGVEIGQCGIVIVAASTFEAIRWWNSGLGHRVSWAGSLIVIAAGAYWFFQRVLFPA